MVKISGPIQSFDARKGGLFSLDSLKEVIAQDSVSQARLSVRVFYDCYLLKTRNGFRVFDTNFDPLSISFTYRGGVGRELVPVVKKGDQFAFIEKKINGKNAREWVSWEQLRKMRDEVDYVKLDSLFFMLPLHNEFGHALTEGLSRFWPLIHEDLSDVQYVFNGVFSNRNKDLAAAFWEAFGRSVNFNCKNLDDKELVTSFRVKKIYIPEPGLHLCGVYNEIMGDVWRRIVNYCSSSVSINKILGNYKNKIYLSRARVKKRICTDEGVLEKIFRDNGFDIIYPEELSFEEQVVLVNQSAVVAGLSGSALHLSQFMKAGSKLIALTPFHHVMPDLVPVSEINSIDLMCLIGGVEADDNTSSVDGYKFLGEQCSISFIDREIKNFLRG